MWMMFSPIFKFNSSPVNDFPPVTYAAIGFFDPTSEAEIRLLLAGGPEPKSWVESLDFMMVIWLVVWNIFYFPIYWE